MQIVCGFCSNRPVQGVLLPVLAITEGTSRVPIYVATPQNWYPFKPVRHCVPVLRLHHRAVGLALRNETGTLT